MKLLIGKNIIEIAQYVYPVETEFQRNSLLNNSFKDWQIERVASDLRWNKFAMPCQREIVNKMWIELISNDFNALN